MPSALAISRSRSRQFLQDVQTNQTNRTASPKRSMHTRHACITSRKRYNRLCFAEFDEFPRLLSSLNYLPYPPGRPSLGGANRFRTDLPCRRRLDREVHK